MTAPPGLGASVRASFVGLKSSPSTSSLILQYVNPPNAVAAVPAVAAAAVATLPNSGPQEGFVVKYNSAGVVQWAAHQGETGGTAYDTGFSVAVDSSGNVYVSGDYGSSPFTLYNYDGTAFATTLPNSGAIYSFVAKYNSAGVVQWAARQGGGGSDVAFGVAVDSSGNVYVAGYYGSGGLTLYNA